MFDGQLELGDIAAKLVNYQSERSVEGIRKTGDGKFGFVFARACANLLRKSPNEGRCMPTFTDVVESIDATSGKALLELLGTLHLPRCAPPYPPRRPSGRRAWRGGAA